MKYFLFFCMVLVGNAEVQGNSMDTSRIGQDNSKGQVITLTKEKLALEIENKKLQGAIDDLKRTLADLTKEKLDIEKDLSSLDKELSSVEQKLEVAEQDNQRLKDIVDQITRVIKAPQ